MPQQDTAKEPAALPLLQSLGLIHPLLPLSCHPLQTQVGLDMGPTAAVHLS